MDVQVGDVDIQSFEIHGAQHLSIAIMVTCCFYIVFSVYQLYTQKKERDASQQWPLLEGKCEL